LGDLGVDGTIRIQSIKNKYEYNLKAWNGFIWLRPGTSGRFLRTRYCDIWIPYKARNLFNSWVTISFSRRTLFRRVTEAGYEPCVFLEGLREVTINFS